MNHFMRSQLIYNNYDSQVLVHLTNSLAITNLILKSPCSSISMHINLMNNLHGLSVLTVHTSLIFNFYKS